MNNKFDNWKYIHEYRRVQGKIVQLKQNGKWVTLDFKSNRPPNSNTIQ
jgi:hypothetical protein